MVILRVLFTPAPCLLQSQMAPQGSSSEGLDRGLTLSLGRGQWPAGPGAGQPSAHRPSQSSPPISLRLGSFCPCSSVLSVSLLSQSLAPCGLSHFYLWSWARLASLSLFSHLQNGDKNNSSRIWWKSNEVSHVKAPDTIPGTWRSLGRGSAWRRTLGKHLLNVPQ